MPVFDPNGLPGHQYRHQRTAKDPWLSAIVDAGVKFWRDRGVYVGGVDLDVADNLGKGVMGVGMTPGVYGQSRVVLDGGMVGARLRVARNRKYSAGGRRRNFQQLATYVFHELGHVGELEHTRKGLMDQFADTVPWEARVMSRKLIRPDPRVWRKTKDGRWVRRG